MSEVDDHPGIPRDANGVPIFFTLPPEMQASYDRRMIRCERAWLANKDPLAVAEATTWAFHHRQPIPTWLHEAIWALAEGRRGKQHATRALNAAVRLRRYETVRVMHGGGPQHGGLTWEGAYERAAELLASTPAAGESETMKADYCRVKADLKAGRGGLYFRPKHRNTTG